MIEGVFVRDTMILVGIGNDVTGYCTGCRRGGGYQGQWKVFLYLIP